MKSASRADVRVAAAVTLVVLIVAAPVRASAQPAWVACAGAGQGAGVLPLRRLTALDDKAPIEAEIARVFAQREKEQRVSAANLAKARLSIDFLYVAGDGARRQYYYEASKTILDAEGLLRVVVSGWLRGDGVQPRSLGSKGELHWLELGDDPDADREVIPEPKTIPEPAPSLVPVGVVGNVTAHIWVMRRGIGNGTMLVYEVSPGRVSLRPLRAGCAPG